MFNTPKNAPKNDDTTQVYDQDTGEKFPEATDTVVNIEAQEPVFVRPQDMMVRMIMVPEKFDGTPSKARQWWDDYRYACSVNEWGATVSCKRLPAYLEKSARNWFINDVSDTPSANDFELLEEAFIEQYIPRRQKHEVRKELASKRQQSKEPVGNFITDMNKLCSDYNAKMSEEDRIDRIIDKLLPHFFPHIVEEDFETVKELKRRAVRLEEGILRKGDNTAVASITRKTVDKKYGKSESKSTHKIKCYNCNGSGHISKNCPSEKKKMDKPKTPMADKLDKSKIKCYGCNKLGHYKSECRSKPVEEVSKNSTSAKKPTVASILPSIRPKMPMELDCEVDGNKVRGMVDCGAAITVIHENIANDLGLAINLDETPRMATAGSSDMSVSGVTSVKFAIIIADTEKSCKWTLLVAKHIPHDLIIGYDILSKLGVSANFGTGTLKFENAIKNQNGGVFLSVPTKVDSYSSIEVMVQLY